MPALAVAMVVENNKARGGARSESRIKLEAAGAELAIRGY
jgi:hypothetical protein